MYVALGWAAVFWLGDFAATATPSVLTLIIVGGGLYSLGGVVYGLSGRTLHRAVWFHEVFHSFTIAAFTVHYVGASIAIYMVEPAAPHSHLRWIRRRQRAHRGQSGVDAARRRRIPDHRLGA